MFWIYFEKCSACCSWMESSISSSSRLLVSCMASGINLTGMLKEWTEDRQTDKNMTKWAVCTLMERRQGEHQHIYVYKREGLASLGRRSLQGGSHRVQSSRRKLQWIASVHTAQCGQTEVLGPEGWFAILTGPRSWSLTLWCLCQQYIFPNDVIYSLHIPSGLLPLCTISEVSEIRSQVYKFS